MRIQIIDKNTAKCYMNIDDLEELNISIEEIKESIKMNNIQHNMLDKIMSIIENMNNELIYNGQEPFVKDFSLVSVHIVVMANDTLELTINTRPANIPSNIEQELPIDDIEKMIENDEDLPPMPKFLENIIKSTLGLPVDWNDYEENYKIEEIAPNPNHIRAQQKTLPINEIDTNKQKKEKNLKKNYIILSFKDINSVISFSKVIPNIKTSILVKNKGQYYLLFNNLNVEQKKCIDYVCCEFYEHNNEKIPTKEFLLEHGDVIIKENAIETLKNL